MKSKEIIMTTVINITAVKVEEIQGPCVEKDEWGGCREYAFSPNYKYTTADGQVYQLCFAPRGDAPHGVPAYAGWINSGNAHIGQSSQGDTQVDNYNYCVKEDGTYIESIYITCPQHN